MSSGVINCGLYTSNYIKLKTSRSTIHFIAVLTALCFTNNF